MLNSKGLPLAAVNRMDEISRKELAFYLMIGCSILSLGLAIFIGTWWYVLTAAAFAGMAIYARRERSQAIEASKMPTEQYLRGVNDAAFLRKR